MLKDRPTMLASISSSESVSVSTATSAAASMRCNQVSNWSQVKTVS